MLLGRHAWQRQIAHVARDLAAVRDFAGPHALVASAVAGAGVRGDVDRRKRQGCCFDYIVW